MIKLSDDTNLATYVFGEYCGYTDVATYGPASPADFALYRLGLVAEFLDGDDQLLFPLGAANDRGW